MSHKLIEKEEDIESYISSTSSSESAAVDISQLCTFLPCCMNEEESANLGHHVSIFMVSLLAFATFFCVTLILILVFVLG
uniref:Uncharacterized protein n=1 Tax=Panagrolaimus sp. ES5 TaxID=591445 RepID=A0AC34GTY9_9BILA